MKSNLTRDQIETLHFLEGSVGPIIGFSTEDPILQEFDLGPQAVVMEFDKARVVVRADGGISPIPRLKRL